MIDSYIAKDAIQSLGEDYTGSRRADKKSYNHDTINGHGQSLAIYCYKKSGPKKKQPTTSKSYSFVGTVRRARCVLGREEL